MDTNFGHEYAYGWTLFLKGTQQYLSVGVRSSDDTTARNREVAGVIGSKASRGSLVRCVSGCPELHYVCTVLWRLFQLRKSSVWIAQRGRGK